MTATLPPKLQAMVDELAGIDDLEEKYLVLIDMGSEVPDIPADRKTPACLIQGCQSVVHAYTTLEGGKLRLHGYADAKIVNGMLALLVLGLDGLTPREFLAVDPRFIEKTGVIQTLTPSRVNGFYNIHERLKAEALIALAQGDAHAD
jgi:cysteine desulfuration protein SufE